MFSAYFKAGEDIGELSVLVKVAERSGMDGSLAQKLLISDADTEAVSQREEAGRHMGITSVPTFIVAEQHVVRGAQQPDLWRRVIDDLAAVAQS